MMLQQKNKPTNQLSGYHYLVTVFCATHAT